jgi:hypothetical protein
MVEGGKPVMEESSRMPTLPASATASMVSMAFRLVLKSGRMKIIEGNLKVSEFL